MPSVSHNQNPFLTTGAGKIMTTCWTMVLDAGGDAARLVMARWEQFARAYWYPVYAFICRRGNSAEMAQDLTRSFFAQLLEKNWLAGVERRETRFSTLLLNILGNYLVSKHRRASREKRGGGSVTLSLDMAAAEQWFGAEPCPNAGVSV